MTDNDGFLKMKKIWLNGLISFFIYQISKDRVRFFYRTKIFLIRCQRDEMSPFLAFVGLVSFGELFSGFVGFDKVFQVWVIWALCVLN